MLGRSGPLDAIDRTGWRGLRLPLLIRPRSIASMALIFLPAIFYQESDDGWCTSFACTIESIRAKLRQRRVHFAADHVLTVRGWNQAINGSSGTAFTLMLSPTPEPPLSPTLLACSYRFERERVGSTNAAPTLRVTRHRTNVGPDYLDRVPLTHGNQPWRHRATIAPNAHSDRGHARHRETLTATHDQVATSFPKEW